MRRTLERDNFSISGVAPGDVLVASTFIHPTRGPVDCPAAPVASAAMLAPGLRVGHRPAPPVGSGDAILHTVSYVDPNGTVVGLGVAAHRDDGLAVRRAEEVVRSWAEAMRTRRVLTAATGPSCAGLRREAAMLAKVAGPAYVLAGRRDVPNRWPHRDVRYVDQVADVPVGATVVLPAHGVDRRTRAEATDRGLPVVDATCPLVTHVHDTARRFADEGTGVVLIGGAGHAAMPPIAGAAPMAVVTTVEEVDELVVDNPDRVAFVVSPGLAVEDAAVLAARLRSRFGRAPGQHPDEFCYSASDRRAAARAVASCSDLTLVLGDRDLRDTGELAATATATGSTVERLDDAGQLRPEWLAPAASVGILVATSARPDLAGEVIEVLSGLGPLSITRRQVATEIRHAAPARVGTRRAS
jgi:(E)-4-hydroxy-3-methyl-but-2-enyl pyrophosphate reductase